MKKIIALLVLCLLSGAVVMNSQSRKKSAKKAKTTKTTKTIQSTQSKSNQTFTVNGVSFTMVYVEGGTFTMGATAEQESDADSDEKPAHKVTVSSFSIGQTEVTQELWQAVMGSNPSKYQSGSETAKFPVEKVSWDDCQEFISKLNQKTGKRFRLPTEAEWEFAARGGNKSQGYKYSGSNNVDEVAVYYKNSLILEALDVEVWLCPLPVGTLQPNELGIHDMSGNVSEWCQDKWYNYDGSATILEYGSNRVGRGGDWVNGARGCRVSSRSLNSPDNRSSNYGLRLAL